jgi:tRNA(Ile)-lysidine synthase
VAAHRMIAPGDRVLVAISGGADSTALLHVLAQLSSLLRCRLRACHIHHGLRGADADADAETAAALAESLRVPFTEHRADVRGYAEAGRMSIETAARAVRYRLLESTARRFKADRIATGHTADDQAETVLLNMLRGAGPQGLAGIPPVRGRIIRPLLDITRAAAEEYCALHQLDYRLDLSNLDTALRRNRIRHEILPSLRAIQPRTVEGLCRLAEIARVENDFITELAERSLREIGTRRPPALGIARAPFVALSPALQRRVLRAAIAQVKGDELDVEFERVAAIVRLAASGKTGAVAELPGGLRVELAYGELVIAPAAPEPAVAEAEWSLPVPGDLLIPALGLRFSARRSRARRPPSDPMAALLDAELISPPLTIRTRRRGDRFVPFGMKAAVKLQDFFVNAKVPRAQRARIPLMLSGDEIVWVVGYRVSDRFKVREDSRRTIRLEAGRVN